MLPRRRLACSCGVRSFKTTIRYSTMSESSTRDQSVLQGERACESSRSRTDERVIKDQRWNASPHIRFQRPPHSWRTTCDLSKNDSNHPLRFQNYSTHSHCPTLSSQSSFESADPDLPATRQLSYPDLSRSSFASGNNSFPTTVPSSSPEQQVSSTQSISSTVDRPASHLGFALHEPFRSPQGFHIPAYKFENALNSTPGSAASFWQYTLYEGPDAEKQKVKVHYCKTLEATEAISQMFLDEKVIGFDIEWMPQARSTDSIKRNIALVQFASEERVALFHIARYPGPETLENLVAPTLKKIMESPNISKAGVAIKGDCTRLRKFLDIHCQGLFELSHLHKLVQYRSGNISQVDRRVVRLADQVQEHLKLPLCKGDVQTSNWGRDLDWQQTQYAASDSYAGLLLFHVLESKRIAFDPVPPRPAHAELNVAIALGENGQSNDAVQQRDNGEDFEDTEPVSSTEMSIEELAQKYFQVSLNDNATAQLEALTPEPSSQSTGKLPSTAGINSVEIEIANDFATAFKPQANQRVAPQALRAYSLWHNQGLDIPEVAVMLRTPPVQNNTVISYLCDAINLGRLKYEPKKILEFSSAYSWRPFIKAHRDLFDRAKGEILGDKTKKTSVEINPSEDSGLGREI